MLAQWVMVLGFVVFAYLVVRRPFQSDPSVQNLAVLIDLLIATLSTGIAAASVRSGRSWVIFSAHLVVAGFLVRLIPSLILSLPPYQDPYPYFSTFLIAWRSKSFSPTSFSWFKATPAELHWPLLQSLTVEIRAWTGMSLTDLIILVPPALGALTCVAASLVAYSVYRSWRTAAIAGLLVSFTDVVIFYQSEYHPQGVALLTFSLLIYLILESRAALRLGASILTLLVAGAFLLTHHASALVVPLVLLPLLAIPFLARLVTTYGSEGWLARFKLREMLKDLDMGPFERLVPIVLLLVVCGLSMQIFLSNSILLLVVHQFDRGGLPIANASTGTSLWLLLLRFGKYLLLPISFVGLFLSARRMDAKRLILLVLAVGLAAASAPALATGSTSIDRIISFWALFASVLAAFGLTRWLPGALGIRRWAGALAVGAIAIYSSLGILDAQIPAFYLSHTPRVRGLFYGNALPNSRSIALAGHWVRYHIPRTAYVDTDFATRVGVFFFGRIPFNQAIYTPLRVPWRDYCKASYVVVDPAMDRGFDMPGPVPINYSGYARIYDNGSVVVYQRQRGQTCTFNPLARPKH